MLEVIEIEQKEYWNRLIRNFDQCDIYYTCEYNIALMLHGDGRPQLIYYNEGDIGIAYVMFLNDIADSNAFKDILDKDKYYDWTAPYGYGGPMIKGEMTPKVIEHFRAELYTYCARHHIVSQFFRFHPLLCNHAIFADICELKCLKKTVAIDVANGENIEKNMMPQCRNKIRKAEKNGVSVFCDKGENLPVFLEIYNDTMQYRKADEYYFFEQNILKYWIENLKDQVIFFYAKKDNIVIAASMFFYNDIYMHYHLSGTRTEYRKYAASNLILKSAAGWAHDHGNCKLHLGGGNTMGDSLFEFKKGFCPQGTLDFYIGKTIFDHQAFDELVALRKRHDSTFNVDTPFMIKYRSIEATADMKANLAESSKGGGV